MENNIMTKLIVLEGPDGVGKTTTKSVVEDQLKILGKSFKSLKHPGDTKLGEKIREIFIDKDLMMSALARVHLIAANKVEMLRQSIANTNVDYVIIDRFDLSTVIYQSIMVMDELGVMASNGDAFEESYRYIFDTLVTNIDHDNVEEINYILLDNDDEVLDTRLGNRDKDSIESLGGKFHQRVRQMYRDQNFIKDFIYRYPMKTTVAYTTTNSIDDIKLDMKIHLETLIRR